MDRELIRKEVARELRDILEHASGLEDAARCLVYYDSLSAWEQAQAYMLLTWPDTTFDQEALEWIDHALEEYQG